MTKQLKLTRITHIAWNNKGVALAKLNKSDEAIKAYDKAIEINPHNSNAWNNKGVALV